MDNNGVYLNYEMYQPLLEKYCIDYIPPLCIIGNPSEDKLWELTQKNTYLVKDQEGVGEGIVIKNYEYRNKYGRQTWAKLVTNEFKDKHRREMGSPELFEKIETECKIVDRFLTEAMIQKTFDKIKTKYGGFKSEYIGELLGTTWHELFN